MAGATDKFAVEVLRGNLFGQSSLQQVTQLLTPDRDGMSERRLHSYAKLPCRLEDAVWFRSS